MTHAHVPCVVPDWVTDAIFYQIFPDRFCNGNRSNDPPSAEPWGNLPTRENFFGGDLQGIFEKLDYLQYLGVNALYLNPIFRARTNHKYDTCDYFEVDPAFGSNDQLKALVRELHSRNMRIILDGVFNHSGDGFWAFEDVKARGAASPYAEWFIVRSYPIRTSPLSYRTFGDAPYLPKLNLNHRPVQEHIIKAAKYWLEEAAIDGWRLDVPFLIPLAFWREFRAAVKGVNREAYLVGEIWGEATRWLQGDQFDAVMNYLFTQACIGFFIGDRLDEELVAGMDYAPIPALDAEAFAQHIEGLLALYPLEITLAQLNLLDSHDTARFLTLAGGDVSVLKLASLFQMTYPGAPCIYYGDEVGLEGGRDPDCRRPMTWDETCWDTDLLAYYRRLIAIRQAHPALRRGKYASLHAEGGVYTFLRSLEDEKLVIVLNNSETTYLLDVPIKGYQPDGAVLCDLLGGEEATVACGRLRGLSLSPRTGAILLSSPL